LSFGNWLLLFLFLVTAGFSVRAEAQEIGPGISDNLAAGRAPTDFRSRIRLRSGYLDLSGGTQLAPSSIAGTWAPVPSVALRLRVPVNYVNPGRQGASGEFGIGDLSTRALWRFLDTPRISAFAGVEFSFPSASDPILGTEKYSVIPTAALYVPITDKIAFIPVYQQLVSFAGKESRADINIIRFRSILLAQWPRGWWTMLDPGFLWDLEDDLETKDTMTLGLEVGKVLTPRLAVTGKPSIQTYGTEDFAWAVELSVTFSFD
jgi:hypothetical protein